MENFQNLARKGFMRSCAHWFKYSCLLERSRQRFYRITLSPFPIPLLSYVQIRPVFAEICPIICPKLITSVWNLYASRQLFRRQFCQYYVLYYCDQQCVNKTIFQHQDQDRWARWQLSSTEMALEIESETHNTPIETRKFPFHAQRAVSRAASPK